MLNEFQHEHDHQFKLSFQTSANGNRFKFCKMHFSVVTCGTAPNIAHGTKVADGDMYSNKTTYMCVLGFKINSTEPMSNFSISCLSDGSWESIEYSCIGELVFA